MFHTPESKRRRQTVDVLHELVPGWHAAGLRVVSLSRLDAVAALGRARLERDAAAAREPCRI